MPEPIEPNGESELDRLKKANAELIARHARDKKRIEELEASATALQVKITESETRVRELTIDAPLSELCESISKAPEALQSTLESEFKIEIRGGVMTLVDRATDKPIMLDGKQLPFVPEAMKAFLLATKDPAKKRLYDSILIASKASGGQNAVDQKPAVAPVVKSRKFGLR